MVGAAIAYPHSEQWVPTFVGMTAGGWRRFSAPLQPTRSPSRFTLSLAAEHGFILRKVMLIHRGGIEVCATVVLLLAFPEKAFPLGWTTTTCGFLENAD